MSRKISPEDKTEVDNYSEIRNRTNLPKSKGLVCVVPFSHLDHLEEEKLLHSDEGNESDLHVVRFSWKTFLRETTFTVGFYTIGFFILPLVIALEGKIGAANRGFLPSRNWIMFIWGTIVSLSCIIGLWTPLVASFFVKDNMSQCSNDRIALLGLIVLHAAVIGSKYAYLPESDIASRRKFLFDINDLAAESLNQWVEPSDSTIYWEIHCSSYRQAINIEKLKFVFQQNPDIMQLLLKYFPSEPSVITTGELPLKSLLFYLVKRSTRVTNFSAVKRLIIFLALIHAILPPVGRWIIAQPIFGESWEVLSSVFVLFSSWLLFFTNTVAAFVAVVDYKRRRIIMQNCGFLISSCIRSVRMHNMPEDFPTILVDSPTNLLNWITARKILQDIGAKFYARINVFLSLFMLLDLSFVALVFVQMATSTELNLSTVLLLLYDTIFFAILLCTLVVLGNSVNLQYAVHKDIIQTLQFWVQARLSEKCENMEENASTTEHEAMNAYGGSHLAALVNNHSHGFNSSGVSSELEFIPKQSASNTLPNGNDKRESKDETSIFSPFSDYSSLLSGKPVALTPKLPDSPNDPQTTQRSAQGRKMSQEFLQQIYQHVPLSSDETNRKYRSRARASFSTKDFDSGPLFSQTNIKQLQQLLFAMELIVQQLSVDEEYKSIRVMGMYADSSLIRHLGALMTSVTFAAYRAIMAQDNVASYFSK